MLRNQFVDNSKERNSDDFNKQIEMLLNALEPNEQQLLTKQQLLGIIAKDNDEEKDIEQRDIYNLIREKLGEEAVNKLDERIQSMSEGENDLYSIVKTIYRYKQSYDPNILDFINKDESYFIGKIFDFQDPNGNQSTFSIIETCKFQKSQQTNNIEFSLENNSIFHIQYNNHDVLSIHTQIKRKSQLFELLKTSIGKSSKIFDEIEFHHKREQFIEDNLRIEPGNYKVTLSDKVNNKKFYNLLKVKKDVLYQQNLTLLNLGNQRSKQFVIDTNQRNAIEISIERNSETQEISLQDFRSIICYVLEDRNKINFDTNVDIKEYIHIREIDSEISKQNQKNKEITDIKDHILQFLKADENKQYLNKLLDDLVSNQLSFTSQVLIDDNLKKDFDRICQLFNELNISQTKEKVLQNAVIETTYSKLVDKSKKHFIFQIMNLLEEAFQHIDSVKQMDLVMFWGGTGAGKSVSINYYIGHALEAYNNYGRVYLKLKEKNLKEGTYAKIGQSISTSETTFIHGYKPKDKNLGKLMLCDCPGFEDSRGEVYDLSTMLSIDHAIKNANSIKSIVLTLAYEDFWGGRCRSVLKLFENLKEKVPDIFANKEIRKSVFLLITKYNKNEPIQKNLNLAVNDALSNERSMLDNMQNKEDLKDDVQIKIIEEKIQIWTFVLDIINSKRIISIDIRDKTLRRECLQGFLNAPCIEKKYFSKSMENDTVQRNFSKYISLHIDTWKKHILKEYESELPIKIKVSNEKIKQLKLNISQTKQKNKDIGQSIKDKKNEIQKIESKNDKLKNLLNENNNELIEEELQKNEEFYQHAQDIIYNGVERLDQDIKEIEERIKQNSQKAEHLEEQNKYIEQDIDDLKVQNEGLSNGNTQQILYNSSKYKPDDEMTLIDINDDEYQKSFNDVSDYTLKGTEHKVKAGNYTGKIWHYVYICQDYYIVPKGDSSMTLMDMYNKEFFQGKHKYKATIDGYGWEFYLGMKANPDRKKMVYSIRTKWNAGGTIPWFSITHDLPNIDLNEAKIINNDANIKSLNKTIIEDSSEITRLLEKNKELQNDIALKIQNKNNLEKQIKIEQAQYNYHELQKIIDQNTEFVQNYKKDIEGDSKEIKSNEGIIKSDQKTIGEIKLIRSEQKKRKLHLAIIIKSKIGVAQLLRKFASLSTDGLGIQQENAAEDLVFQLTDYAQYYDSNITKIQNMCDEDLTLPQEL